MIEARTSASEKAKHPWHSRFPEQIARAAVAHHVVALLWAIGFVGGIANGDILPALQLRRSTGHEAPVTSSIGSSMASIAAMETAVCG